MIYNPRNFESISDNRKVESGRLSESTDDDDFWGAKIDWNITDDHRLELLAFEDTSTFTTYDVARGTNAYSNSGGENWSAKYTGYLFDDSLMVSAMYGENEYNLTTTSDLARLFTVLRLSQLLRRPASDVFTMALTSVVLELTTTLSRKDLINERRCALISSGQLGITSFGQV